MSEIVFTILRNESFRIYGASGLVIAATLLINLFTLVINKERAKPFREWFYLGPTIAWTTFALAIERVTELATQPIFLHKTAAEISEQAAGIKFLFNAFGYIVVWFFLYLFIFGLHLKYEYSDNDIETEIAGVAGKTPDETKTFQDKARDNKKWARLFFVTLMANALGALSLLLYHVMLVE